MQLTTFLQDSGGDWDLSAGLRRVPDRATFVRQNLSVSLQFWEGENFLDQREGLPFRLIIGQKYDRRLLESLYREAALATTGVGSVDRVELSYDNVNRILTVDLAASTDEGEDISGPYLVQL